MQIDWIMGLAGGLMIGVAAALYLLLDGRIMGASGIVGGLIDGSEPRRRLERAAFVLGLIAVPGLMVAAGVGGRAAPVAGTGILILAGLLVGFGTRLGSGCTSGHGVCGVSRLSARSIVATIVYILAGIAAVAVARGLGWVG